jgi:small subunit ribosomal protein S1
MKDFFREENGEVIPIDESVLIDFKDGDIVEGEVVRIDRDEVLVDIGYKSEGLIPSNELTIRKGADPHDVVDLGQRLEALVMQKEDADGRLILSAKRAAFERAWNRIEEAYNEQRTVEGPVIEVVKGGLILDIGLRGFLPASLVDIRRVRNLDSFLGQKLECKVIELNRSRNNVVLSRRAVLEEERKEERERILTSLEEGMIVKGTVSNLVDFGAFVDLEGIDGLIHISELSWQHVDHPSEVVEVGEEVEVKVSRWTATASASRSAQADAQGPVAGDRRAGQRRRADQGPRDQAGLLRGLRRGRRGGRGSDPHLRASRAPRRDARRDRALRRRG